MFKIISKIFFLIIILATGGSFYDQQKLVQAANNDFILTWSADSYVPANYQGRALPTRLTTAKVVALPIKKLTPDPEKLYYRWLLDDQIFGSSSGQGKSSFTFLVTRWGGDAHQIELQILDEKGGIADRLFTNVPVVESETLLHQPNSDYAAKDKIAVKTGQNLNLLAAPLFFRIKELTELNFKWSINGQAITDVEEKNSNRLNLKITPGELSKPFTQQLKLIVSRRNDEFQQTTNNLIMEIK